ncbi:sigma D regulator [Sedimenticola selenatireducens]|jgi:regulator of sigma D|uniref:Sigma D regulator n=1 Tax=Sedimenticola selenatireducens TaxID=191960 RepID=A0A558DNX8_9GAMM|nr:Rsd/AlgQ family anti-sigma factor [Sedimenticola selenatireducens]TVO78478.1 sigma D regulator [Sedimenticola selenatireducens]TVT62663.1 MAG: sigma D regulator [Sedimenticola selenatireducens]
MHNSSGQERRARTQEMVDKWLAERQQMLVLYCKLAGIESFDPDKPEKQLLRDFCQLLVDYVAFGHFEVYDRITSGEERRGEVIKVAEKAYPRISEVTDIVVAFNDKYDLSDHIQSMDELTEDLSMLGEELANRIELEDKLVGALLR